MTNAAYLLIALLVSHYLADFCLTMPVMIRAKAVGTFPAFGRPTTKTLLDAIRPRPTTSSIGDCWDLVLLLYEPMRI